MKLFVIIQSFFKKKKHAKNVHLTTQEDGKSSCQTSSTPSTTETAPESVDPNAKQPSRANCYLKH
jgi:hypothetical protein